MIKACIKQCEKIITNISEQLFNQLAQLGYKPLKAENYPVFQLYYRKMNEHYSAVLSFPSMVAWSSDIPTFYKPMSDMLCCLQYEGTKKFLPVRLYFSDRLVSLYEELFMLFKLALLSIPVTYTPKFRKYEIETSIIPLLQQFQYRKN